VALGAAQWNGWGRDLNNSRYQPEPAMRAADVPRLAPKWALGFPSGPVFGGATIVDGRLFVTGSSGRILALDAKTGCSYWSFDPSAGVATALLVGELAAPRKFFSLGKFKRKNAHIEVDKPPSAVLFGDTAGFVYALDAQHGTLLWRVPAQTFAPGWIVGTPTLFKNRCYVPVSTEEHGSTPAGGFIVALDVATGNALWRVSLARGSAGIALLSAPTIDVGRGLLYVATSSAAGAATGAGAVVAAGAATGPGAAVAAGAATGAGAGTAADMIVALDLTDGHLRWSRPLDTAGERSPTAASGQGSPILRNILGGRQIVLTGPHSGVVYGLDPNQDGAILWQSILALDPDSALPQYGSAADYRSIYVGGSGGLTALNIGTGDARWTVPAPTPPCAGGEHDCSHGETQSVTVMPCIVFSGALDGHLRAYSTIDGRIVWDFDTVRVYRSLNGVSATGGPLDHAGPSIVNGMLYIKSGTALLAFSVDGR
jgi:polyvinyl alcohol dehydrogenase (cytochrome)